MRFVVPFALYLCFLALAVAAPQRVDRFVLQAPAGERTARIDPAGTTILPNGRLLTPLGKQIRTAPHPHGMTLSRDGKVLVTVNGGVAPFSLTVIQNPGGENPQVRQIPPSVDTERDILPATFIGAAVDNARDLLYASGGNEGTVVIFRLSTGELLHRIPLSTEQYPDAFTTDIVLAPDGRWLYVLDLANYRLVILNTRTRTVVSSIGVGRNPFALALTDDGSRVYVANMGTFQYSLIETRPGEDPRGIPFPPFGYPSREAREGTVIGGRRVPGLGDPNVPEACSVWGVEVSDPASPRVVVKIKTGLPVGEAIGGSSPAGLAVSADTLYVSNATNDTVEAYDIRTHRRKWRTLLTPAPFLKHLRGVTPFGLALSPEGKRLYVAESGINAVGILDARTGKVLGHIPVCWYPSRVCVSPDGKQLYVANAKGFGAGPNGGVNFTPGPEGRSIGRLMKGTVSLIDVPADKDLPALTQKVILNNGFVPAKVSRPKGHPIPVVAGVPSDKIRYVVFIPKENRTFDEVYGDLPGVNGDRDLARFGVNRRVGEHEGVNVMPNHRALAQQFAISDNFYVDSDHSADGHRWLVSVYPNHWVETITSAGYGGGAEFRRSPAPGRLAFFESNSSLTPEDYLEHGSLWEHLHRNGVTFRNYGEGFEFAGIAEDEDTKPTGARLPVNIPMPMVLFQNTCREYPEYNTNIPDQYRADQFLKEFREKYLSGKEPLPRFLYIYLPNDHGARPRPEKGYPYLESYMADNDLALGRVVEVLSHSPWWKEMAIFITEDDAQSGIDHVDAHRSLLIVVSPWVKRGYVSHQQSSIASIMKTMYLILGVPYLNLYDAAASDLADMFTTKPDFTPYRCLPVDARIFEPEKAKDPADPDYRKARLEPSPSLDTLDEAIRQQEEWERARGNEASSGSMPISRRR
ncbi:MAG: alkaline phosphatase family protein [Armatimonadota bacterium]